MARPNNGNLTKAGARPRTRYRTIQTCFSSAALTGSLKAPPLPTPATFPHARVRAAAAATRRTRVTRLHGQGTARRPHAHATMPDQHHSMAASLMNTASFLDQSIPYDVQDLPEPGLSTWSLGTSYNHDRATVGKAPSAPKHIEELTHGAPSQFTDRFNFTYRLEAGAGGYQGKAPHKNTWGAQEPATMASFGAKSEHFDSYRLSSSHVVGAPAAPRGTHAPVPGSFAHRQMHLKHPPQDSGLDFGNSAAQLNPQRAPDEPISFGNSTARIVAKDVAAQPVPSRVLRGSIGAAQVGNFLGDSDDDEEGDEGLHYRHPQDGSSLFDAARDHDPTDQAHTDDEVFEAEQAPPLTPTAMAAKIEQRARQILRASMVAMATAAQRPTSARASLFTGSRLGVRSGAPVRPLSSRPQGARPRSMSLPERPSSACRASNLPDISQRGIRGSQRLRRRSFCVAPNEQDMSALVIDARQSYQPRPAPPGMNSMRLLSPNL